MGVRQGGGGFGQRDVEFGVDRRQMVGRHWAQINAFEVIVISVEEVSTCPKCSKI